MSRRWIGPVLIALMVAFALAIYGRLPEQVPTHFDFSGRPDDWMNRFPGAFGLPAITAGIYLLLFALRRIDPRRAHYARFEETYWIILNVLALGSPTHPIEPAEHQAYVSTYRWADFYGQQHVTFAPLFGHQYSHSWIAFRGIRDAYMRDKGSDYVETARRATGSQRVWRQRRRRHSPARGPGRRSPVRPFRGT